MNIIIRNRYIEEISFGKILKSELKINIEKKEFEYNREYIPYEVEKPTIKDKVLYTVQGKLNVSEYKLNLLIEHINQIIDTTINNELSNNKDQIIDYLSYIDLIVDNKEYAIKINSLDYELLIHLSTFEFFDTHDIDYIVKISYQYQKINKKEKSK